MIGRTRARMKHIGIIAVMNSDFPVQELIEVGDALLASPVLVMAISVQNPSALDAIAELRRRYDEQMLIGGANVKTVAQVDEVWQHGAQFLIATEFRAEVVAQAHTRGLLAVPGVRDEADVKLATKMGCRMVHCYPADSLAPGGLARLAADNPSIDFVVGGGVNQTNVAGFARAGAVAFSVGNRHVPHISWSAAELIRRTRALRVAWDSAHD